MINVFYKYHDKKGGGSTCGWYGWITILVIWPLGDKKWSASPNLQKGDPVGRNFSFIYIFSSMESLTSTSTPFHICGIPLFVGFP